MVVYGELRAGTWSAARDYDPNFEKGKSSKSGKWKPVESYEHEDEMQGKGQHDWRGDSSWEDEVMVISDAEDQWMDESAMDEDDSWGE